MVIISSPIIPISFFGNFVLKSNGSLFPTLNAKSLSFVIDSLSLLVINNIISHIEINDRNITRRKNFFACRKFAMVTSYTRADLIKYLSRFLA